MSTIKGHNLTQSERVPADYALRWWSANDDAVNRLERTVTKASTRDTSCKYARVCCNQIHWNQLHITHCARVHWSARSVNGFIACNKSAFLFALHDVRPVCLHCFHNGGKVSRRATDLLKNWAMGRSHLSGVRSKVNCLGKTIFRPGRYRHSYSRGSGEVHHEISQILIKYPVLTGISSGMAAGPIWRSKSTGRRNKCPAPFETVTVTEVNWPACSLADITATHHLLQH